MRTVQNTGPVCVGGREKSRWPDAVRHMPTIAPMRWLPRHSALDIHCTNVNTDRSFTDVRNRLVCLAVRGEPSTKNTGQVDRRQALSKGFVACFGSTLVLIDDVFDLGNARLAWAEEGEGTVGPTFEKLNDATLAYAFEYPTTTQSGRSLPLVFSRKPEKYSSAAPLTADARQRIVCELVNLPEAVTVSVSVGPPAGTLRTTKQEDWTAKQVAEQVLVDRSTGRVTSGQRISLSSVEDAYFVERDGRRYCVYEHVSQGSPTLSSQTKETYRHAKAVTVSRPGLNEEDFLYTLNISCPQEKWDELGNAFQHVVDSFVLVEPGEGYIPPNKDPWLFF